MDLFRFLDSSLYTRARTFQRNFINCISCGIKRVNYKKNPRGGDNLWYCGSCYKKFWILSIEKPDELESVLSKLKDKL